jgi:hypothetical protein
MSEVGHLADIVRRSAHIRFTPESCRGCRHPARPLVGALLGLIADGAK